MPNVTGNETESEETMMTGFGVFFAVLMALLVFAYLSSPGPWLRDDATDGAARSGMVIYTDYGTGVQYLGTALGGLTPRLDAAGKVMVSPTD